MTDKRNHEHSGINQEGGRSAGSQASTDRDPGTDGERGADLQRTTDRERNADNSRTTGDSERVTGEGTGERGYRGDSAPDTPSGRVPGGSHGGGGYRQGGLDTDSPEDPEHGFQGARANPENLERGEWETSRREREESRLERDESRLERDESRLERDESRSGPDTFRRDRDTARRDPDALRRDESGHERSEWRDGFGAYGFPGYEESGAKGPRTGYGEQGFGAGESHGGRWGGGTRGGYGGGNPGAVHGSRGGSRAAGGERFEQGRGPRSYGPDGWGGGPEPAGPGQRGSTWGGGSRGRRGSAGTPGRHDHADTYGIYEAPWRQSEFAGRGEFGDHDRGTWNDERAYSSRADIEPGTTRGEDWSVPGPFSGRGPRDYRRPEAAIRDDVCERLTRHGHLDASRIRVQVENGEVMLEGTVDSRMSKRLAEDVAETVSGVRDVHNRLRIRQSEHDRERTDRASDR